MFPCGLIITLAKCNLTEVAVGEGRAGLVSLAFPYVQACLKGHRSLIIFSLHHQYPTLAAQRVHCEKLFLLSSFLACVLKTFFVALFCSRVIPLPPCKLRKVIKRPDDASCVPGLLSQLHRLQQPLLRDFVVSITQ